jgi:murein DD-endopeptidase MepM/ murein hydrolase activator NlpD
VRRVRKKRNTLKSIYYILFMSIIGGFIYLYNSSFLERNEPIIEMPNQVYWNMKEPLDISMNDDSGIKHYKVVFSDSKSDILLDSKTLQTPETNMRVKINPPKSGVFFERNNAELIVEATDISNWNLLAGNSTTKRVKVIIDTKKPQVKVIDSSYGIKKGGSALVIFKADDKNLKDVYIKTNYGKKFLPIKFYKDGYFASLVAWPLWERSFKGSIVATDKAGNTRVSVIRLHLKSKTYKVSRIKLKDRFLDGKISDLYEELDPKKFVDSSLDKFRYINEDERKSNEDLIHTITSKIEEDSISSYSINPFYPLKGAAVVARYGDHRLFYKRVKSKVESKSYHLGLDLASTKMAPIKTTNNAKVAFNGFNGIYGNMVILYHGLGVYTLYGHCSNTMVNIGDNVKENEAFAQTGKSGLALGDHLHFGVLVQGIEVRPEEWMDKNWLKVNIFDTIENAKKFIDS